MHIEALGVLYYTMYMYVYEELEYTHSIIHGLVTLTIIKLNFVSVPRVYYTLVLTANAEN